MSLADEYGFTGQFKRVIAGAERDPDPVSMMVLGDSHETAEGAVVVLKGRDTVLLFEQWAKRNKIMDESPCGMVEAMKCPCCHGSHDEVTP